MTTTTTPQHDLAARISRVRELVADPARLLEAAQALEALRGECRGQRTAIDREIFGGANPRDRCHRFLKRARRKLAKAAQPKDLAGPEITRRYGRLFSLLQLPRQAQPGAIANYARQQGVAERTVRGWLRAMCAPGEDGNERGVEALRRKERSDKGKRSIIPEQARSFFYHLRTDKQTRHLTVANCIRATRKQFGGELASDASFYAYAKRIPEVARMPSREFDATYLPKHRIEVPHPNHTWVFDFSKADLFVWDGDPAEKPYRPEFTAIIDECSRSCMAATYTREPANRAVLQSMLLFAILPKHQREGEHYRHWIQYGMPTSLHCDNGKVQQSNYLQAVLETVRTELGWDLQLHHADPYHPYQDGHVEAFNRVVHHMFEPMLAGFCGNDPKNKPECYPDTEHPKRSDFLTLAELNQTLHIWIPTEHHTRPNRGIGKSPLQAWQAGIQQHLSLPDAKWLYSALLQRVDRGGIRRISRGELRCLGSVYLHANLMDFDGVEVEVRYDACDLSRVLLLDPITHKLLLGEGEDAWATRQRTLDPSNAGDMAELGRFRAGQRQRKKVLQQAGAEIAAMPTAEREQTLEKLRKGALPAPGDGILPFPGAPKRLPAHEPAEPLSMDEAGALLARARAVQRGEILPPNGDGLSEPSEDDVELYPRQSGNGDGNGTGDGDELTLHGIPI